ncbi:WbqC family protein [uncultured Sphingomonas sp.]|uniref:WbqC family protein n=1 Tax=uncultured Sphingomonas sp. TaxID=158754 RepID=UPI0035CC0613
MSLASSSIGQRRRRLAISQSNFIPWRGYFDLIASVDEFIFYDDVQYTKGDWRNRNKIKTPQGTRWLTIPVGADLRRRICDVSISDPQCGSKHWTVLTANYARAEWFEEMAAWLRPFFVEPWTSLSALNRRLTAAVCMFLGIDTKLSMSADYRAQGDRTGRLVALCEEAGASTYVSGPSAAAYLDVEAFRRRDVEVVWMDYDGYPDHPQLWGPFDPRVSILDLLFNCGPNSRRFMKLGLS